ncbi:MAG TPA: type II toxin-antitoxin system RelE/ParE family toxin [Reyranella sp.]|nr:type II toxin-antitoxin system RelE/ParE family toxin [Reyranella sp.]
MIELLDYRDSSGQRPIRRWLDRMDPVTRARIARALVQLSLGNMSEVKSVGSGVLERRLDFGPGYRLYFGRDGETLIILLAGGTKNRQQRDIETARRYWEDYKRRKRGAV